MISIFFDMDGAGLSNMDMEYTRYLINLFKNYYPHFLNYILIFEMAWVLNGKYFYYIKKNEHLPYCIFLHCSVLNSCW